MVSCFDIIEDITINDDGSGKIFFALNLSKSKTKLKSIMLLDSINGNKVPSENDINKHITDLKSKISKINGVSNVKKSTNFKDYIFSLSCNFTSVNVLNNIISNLGSASEAKLIKNNKHFTYNKATRTFSRNYHYDIAKEFKKVKSKDREIFDGAAVTTIYRFESGIASVKNKDSRISKNKTAVFLQVKTKDIINNKKNIKNTIQLQ